VIPLQKEPEKFQHFDFQTKMKFLLLSILVTLLGVSSALPEPLKAFEHRLVDVCGVRDLLEANCNGESYS
jgi:hypothetical protein